MKISDSPNIDVIIQKSLDFNARYRTGLQLNTVKPSYNAKILEKLHNISDFEFVDAIGGSKAPDGVRRYRANKTFDDVIQYAETGIVCGIKIVHSPLMKIHEWDNWEGGYIEGFIRMDGDIEHSEYFIWSYTRMSKLRELLEEFQHCLK